jgi:hypothetical protein
MEIAQLVSRQQDEFSIEKDAGIFQDFSLDTNPEFYKTLSLWVVKACSSYVAFRRKRVEATKFSI